MSDPFVAEIKMFGGNFAPTGWAFCDGQLLPISQNTALFSLLGTYYGGDGKSTFALPDLRGRVPLQHGQGPGLSNRDQGETGGAETVTLTPTEIPAHTHSFALPTTDANATSDDPQGRLPARTAENTYATSGTVVDMAPFTSGDAGGAQPHNNLQPYLTVTFIIALQGIFPPRS
jgi:microcystin-dependent protein